MTRILIFTIVALAFAASLAACQSKFEEKKADGYQVDSDAKKEYTMNSQDIQKKLSNAQDVIHGIKAFVDKANIPSVGKLGVSDLILEIMESIKEGKTEKTDTGYVSEGEYSVSTPGISKECRLMRTRSVYVKTATKTKHTLELLTCKTKGKFEIIADLSAEGSEVSVILKEDLNPILPDMNLEQFLSVQRCDLERQGDKITKIDCQASDLVINPEEKIKFSTVSYQLGREPEFVAKGIVMKGQDPRLKISLEVDKNGKVTAKVDKAESQ